MSSKLSLERNVQMFAAMPAGGRMSGVEWSLLSLAMAIYYGLCVQMSALEGIVVGGLTGLLVLWFAWRRQAVTVLMLLFPALGPTVLPAARMIMGEGLAPGWPWHVLVPVLLALIIMMSFPSLRTRLFWLRPGRVDVKVLAWTAGVSAASVAGLLIWFLLAMRGRFPIVMGSLSGAKLLLMAAGFAILNAVLEEVPFRGMLQPALEELGAAPGLAIGIQGAAFGLLHVKGFPSGVSGCLLAGLYGVALGMLRRYSGGLAAPILAHIVADATIVGIVIHWG